MIKEWNGMGWGLEMRGREMRGGGRGERRGRGERGKGYGIGMTFFYSGEILQMSIESHGVLNHTILLRLPYSKINAIYCLISYRRVWIKYNWNGIKKDFNEGMGWGEEGKGI